MTRITLHCLLCLGSALWTGVQGHAADTAQPLHPKFGFPVYTNAPAGRQLGGQHAPANTPALSTDEAQKRFTVPPGFEVRLFAAEPDIANPVAMSWDDRGRLWVLELYEYPMGAPEGATPRDRIKILEDTNNDGRADSVKVFADGLNLATGLLVGHGGVYVGQAPHLYFMRDTDGDDVADEKTIVLTGFGLEDRHELLNGFAWGPDGWMYMTHGVFTHSKAINPDAPDAAPVVLTAGVARYRPADRFFEVFAEGTSNPWGVDFDGVGNAFVSACVIDHLFHLAPGGNYVRQAGQPPYPYAYGLLPSIVDHRHHMAAYAGVQVYLGNQYPAEYLGTVLQGNIHDNAIHQDRLTARGASFVASFEKDFVRANDGWFMPVSTQVGPDGAVWIMDWYDRYPCYQNANADPAGVDREYGRIWRVVHVGAERGKAVPSRPETDMALSTLSTTALVELLEHPNAWHRRTAQRVLSDRRDPTAQALLTRLFRSDIEEHARLAAFWTLHSSGQLTEAVLDAAALDEMSALRHWAARLTGERKNVDGPTAERLMRLAMDTDPTVQAGVATALRQYVSGQMTVNTPPKVTVEPAQVGALLARLIQSAHATDDRTLSFLIWTALEPLVVPQSDLVLRWFAGNGPATLPLSGQLGAKMMRRLSDERNPALLDQVVEFLRHIPDSESGNAFGTAVLSGLIEGQRGKALLPNTDAEPVLQALALRSHTDVADRARQLGSLWGDVAAMRTLLGQAKNRGLSDPERLQAIEASRQSRAPEVPLALLEIVQQPGSEPVRIGAVRALSEVGNDATAGRVLSGWDTYTPALRRAVSEICVTRKPWQNQLLRAVEGGGVKRGDLPPTVVRSLLQNGDATVAKKAEELFGRYQAGASSTEKLRLIQEKRDVVIRGPVDLAAGREVAKAQCLICHKLHGEGSTVGPDLTGVGRSSLDALLHNVINPNEIIGQGYENVVVETRDDRVLSGRLMERSDTRIRLLQAGDQEEVIDARDIQSVTITENSMMPEGLEQVPDDEFRNLIWYILAPPQDGRPLTEERRQELIGGSETSAVPSNGADGESVALWAPEWQVDSPEFEGAPAKLPEHAGRKNVLMTHPYDGNTPAALVRALQLPQDRKARLRFAVASDPRGDWQLRVVADGEVIHRRTVASSVRPWNEVELDLTRYAGRRIVLRLENAATDWNWEFGYWADLELLFTER